MSGPAIEGAVVVGIKSSSLRRAVSGLGPTAPARPLRTLAASPGPGVGIGRGVVIGVGGSGVVVAGVGFCPPSIAPSSHQRSRAVWVGPIEAPDAAEGGAGGVGGGGVGGGGVGVGGGSEPGSERTPPGIQLARGSMSSALRREVAAPMPPPEGFDRSPCQVTLAVAPRNPPFVQPSPRRRSSAVGSAANAEPSPPEALVEPAGDADACPPAPARADESPADGLPEVAPLVEGRTPAEPPFAWPLTGLVNVPCSATAPIAAAAAATSPSCQVMPLGELAGSPVSPTCAEASAEAAGRRVGNGTGVTRGISMRYCAGVRTTGAPPPPEPPGPALTPPALTSID